MLQKSPQQSYFLRKMQASRQTLSQASRPGLTIEPARVQIPNFTPGKISVVVLTLTNQTRLPRKLKVLPPRCQHFELKNCPQEIPGRQSLQFMVCFNPQKQRERIEDELVIRVEGEPLEVHIPISCIPRLTIGQTQSSRILDSRENIELPSRRSRQPSKLRRNPSKHSIMLPSGPLICSERQVSSIRDPRGPAVADFQQKFRRVSEQVRQKQLKNEVVYKGDRRLGRDKQQEISKFHYEVAKAERQRLQKEVTHRFETRYQAEGPTMCLPTECTLSWSLTRNTPSITFELGMRKIQEEVRKYVVSMRFQKIRDSLKLFEDYRRKQEELGHPFRIADYYDQHILSMDQVPLQFDLDFDRNSLRPSPLPTHPENRPSTACFQVTQRIGFDNWVPIPLAQPGYWELYRQKQVELPAYFYHHEKVVKDHLEGRPQETHFRQSLPLGSTSLPGPAPLTPHPCPQDFLKVPQRTYFYDQEDIQPDLISFEEAMSLGPLRPERCGKRPLASLQSYGILSRGAE